MSSSDTEQDATTPPSPTPTPTAQPTPSAAESWERDLVNRIAFASLNEQRRSRRWGIFFKGLLFLYLFALLLMALPQRMAVTGVSVGRHTALVNVQGIIAPDTDASADNVITGLRAAFEDKRTAGVILRINSPGGSPVQAGYINDEIERLRAEHPDIPLYAVITDVCASGGYYIAVAADKIYADKASIVGSIGVLMNGFGFVDAMEKLGVERRLLTAGENKGMLDPFSPERPQDVRHIQMVLNDIHQQFIEVVKKGRGDRLKDNDGLFSGLIWTGEQSVELGLVDGLGSSSYVARDIIGQENIVDFTPRPDFFERVSRGVGVALGRSVTSLFDGSQPLR